VSKVSKFVLNTFGVILLLFFGAKESYAVGQIKRLPDAKPVRWDGSENIPELFVSVGRFTYESKQIGNVETYENYLIAWIYHHNEEEYIPVIADMLWGHAPEIRLQDLNDDGFVEIILSYHAGAHTQIWKVYARGDNQSNPTIPFRPIANIGSDWGRIKVLNSKKNNFYVIESWNRDWEDQMFVNISQHQYVDGEYRTFQSDTKKLEDTKIKVLAD